MSSRWGIPKEVEIIVLKRDLKCIYCGNIFNDSNITRKTKRTWEHIINDIKIIRAQHPNEKVYGL